MDAPHNQVFFPSTLAELFSAWSRFPNAVPYAGGTELAYGQGSKLMDLPSNIISLDKIQELHKITRTERYIEIGTMVRLNDLIRIGKIVPEILRSTIKEIASPPLRNVATIGGNICYAKRTLDTHAPLIALDARYELKTATASRWVAAARFNAKDDSTSALDKQELLTRIRIPLETWDYIIFRKFEKKHFGSHQNGVVVFIAKVQKNIIGDVRLVFAGDSIIRNRDFEAGLSGKQLPLDRKTAQNFTGLWDTYLSGLEYPGGILREKILNFIRITLQDMTD